jgi:hypothetical protein
MHVTIGADPELFMQSGNKLISAIDKWGGTKEFPIPLGIGDGFAVLEDNVMVEFNIPPADSDKQFVENIQLSLSTIEKRIKDMGYEMSVLASGNFDKDQLDHWAAFVFGCDPDYNAYSGVKNAKPSIDAFPNFRSCGGHVHVGCGELTFDQACAAVAFCDLHLGIPSMLLDTDVERKKLYGKAGAFRVKPYGFEYRTLSNFWIFSPHLIKWVYHAAQRAVEHYQSGFNLEPFYHDIQNAINNNDKELQKKLISHFNLGV